MYEWIKREYPIYTENYAQILFEGNEEYYTELVKKYQNHKRIIFMSELWGEN